MCALHAITGAPSRVKKVTRALARFVNRDLFEGALGEALIVETPQRHRIQGPQTPEGLPSVSELYRLFDLYNKLYFDNKLPKVSIGYSNRMLAAGLCTPDHRDIKLGVKYHQKFPEDIEDTLLHEMIHLIHPAHDAAFKRMASKLGVSLTARFHPDLVRPPKYLYQCPACLREYPRQKRARELSCGPCSGPRFDARFKLRLIRSAAD